MCPPAIFCPLGVRPSEARAARLVAVLLLLCAVSLAACSSAWKWEDDPKRVDPFCVHGAVNITDYNAITQAELEQMTRLPSGRYCLKLKPQGLGLPPGEGVMGVGTQAPDIEDLRRGDWDGMVGGNWPWYAYEQHLVPATLPAWCVPDVVSTVVLYYASAWSQDVHGNVLRGEETW